MAVPMSDKTGVAEFLSSFIPFQAGLHDVQGIGHSLSSHHLQRQAHALEL